MTIIECPWCAIEVAFDAAQVRVRCDACRVEVDFAPEPAIEELAMAA